MDTLNGNTITQTDPYRHKFADAISEYVYDDMDLWHEAHGDAESPVGWFSQLGKRIIRGDSQGFVWVEKFGNAHEASMIARALHIFDDAWHACEPDGYEWNDEIPEEFGPEHDQMIEQAGNYLAYSYACDAESCDPLEFDVWALDSPAGPLG